MNILETPVSVQNAVKAGHLKLVLAEKVSRLDGGVQTELADQLAGLTERRAINDLVSLYVITHPTPKERVSRAISSFAACLGENLQQIEPMLQQIEAETLSPHRRKLKQGLRLLKTLLAMQTDTMSGDAAT